MKIRMHRLLSMLMAIMMVMSMMSSALADTVDVSNSVSPSGNLLFRASTSGEDLFPFITDLQIKSTQGTTPEGGLLGTSVKVDAEFHIDPKDLRHGNELIKNWYLSKDKLGLEKWQTLEKTKIVKDGKLQGYLSIDADNVYFELDEAYLQQAYNGGGADGTFTAAGSWKKSENSTDNKWDVQVGDDHYTVYPNGVGDISVKKTAGDLAADGTITWNIVVSSNKGTNGEVTLIDTPMANTYVSNGTEVTSVTPACEYSVDYDDESGYTMTLPQMAAGSKYTIVMTTKLTDEAKKIEGKVTNEVSVKSPSYDGKLLEASSNADKPVYFKKVKIDKYGEYNWGTGLIEWKITVNSDKVDIAGWTLTDVLNGRAMNWDSLIDLNISPDNGYTKSGTTITFGKVNGQPNTQEYTITFKTLPTADSKNPGHYQDHNEAILTNGSETVKDAHDVGNRVNQNDWIRKSGSFNAVNREVTWTITINPQHYNIAGMNFDDQFRGGEYTFVSTNYNDTKCVTLAELIAAVNAKIDDDTVNSVNTNSYEVSYKTVIPEGVNQVSNIGYIGEHEGGSGNVGTGILPGMIEKRGDVVAGTGLLKWTIKLNPNKATIQSGWKLEDELTDGNSPYAADQKFSVQTNDGAAVPYSAASKEDMLDQVNEILKTGVGTKNTYVIVYYTQITEGGRVQNKASWANQSAVDWEDVWNSYGVSKKYKEVVKPAEGSDEYQLNWEVEIPYPNVTIPKKVTITDTLSGNHYMKVADLEAIRAWADEKLGEGATIAATDSDGEICKGFTLTLPNGMKGHQWEGTAVLPLKSYVKAADYTGTMANDISLKVEDGREWKGHAEMTPDTDLKIKKDFTGSSESDDRGTTAKDPNKLKWTVTMPVPAGLGGKTITIKDRLPQDIQLTSVKVSNGKSFTLLANGDGAVNGNGGVDGCGDVQVSTNGTTLTVTFNGQNMAVDSIISIDIIARATEEFMDGIAEGDRAELVNYVQAFANHGSSNEAKSSIYVKKEPTQPAITKYGEPAKDLFNTADYSMEINPEARKLLTTEGGKLTVEDTLTINVKDTILENAQDLLLVLSSPVTVTTPDGSASIPGCSISPVVIARNGNVITATIRMEVPDATAMRVNYQYRISGIPVPGSASKTNNLEFTNRVVLNGEEWEGSHDVTTTIEYTFNASANLDSAGVAFIKTEPGMANHPIEGAHFELELKGATVATAVSDETGRLQFSWIGENKWAKNVIYTLTETSAPEYWVQDMEPIRFSIGRPNGNGQYDEIYINGSENNITNSPVTTSVSGKKTWVDGNDVANRPQSIQVWLYADDVPTDKIVTVTPDVNGEWKYTFAGLRKYNYETKKEIKYTVREIGADAPNFGYDAAYDGMNVTNRIKNTSITVNKTWDDNDNANGMRPASITFRLYADGNESEVTHKTVTAEDGWTCTFENLPVLNAAGSKIVYTVQEDAVQDYVPVYGSLADGVIAIENDYTPEKVSVSGSKTWNDSNNQDGKRPDSITIRLWREWGNHESEMIESKVVTAEDNWAWSFTDLNKYKDGALIAYTITEDNVPEYEEPVVNGYDVKNTHIPETVSISGTKTWVDNDNQDGMRPESIRVVLLANGVEVKNQTVTAKNDWKWTFSNLPKYKDGQVIKYTFTEDPVYGYALSVDEETGTHLVNTHIPSTIGVSGSKTWVDNDNQDGMRPKSITICLLANGVEIKEQTVTDENGWKWTFENLPEFENGEKITYEITEKEVDGYTSEVDGFNVKNCHTTEKTSVSGKKIWVDYNNQEGKRPEFIYVVLRGNGKFVDIRKVTAADNWEWAFTDLDKFANGQEITYTVEEFLSVSGYTTAYDGYDVINTIAQDYTKLFGSKSWIVPAGTDVPDVMINLLRDGVKIDEFPLTEGATEYAFTDLPVYAVPTEGYTFDEYDGHKFEYTVTEDAVEGYTSVQTGNNFTNTIAQDYTELSGVKTWIDPAGTEHATIVIRLYRDGEEVLSKELPNGETKYEFTDLPVYAVPTEGYTFDEYDGHVFEYTVTEDKVEGYTSVQIGNNFTNTIAQDYTELSGVKTWIDPEGTEHATIVINLLRDGEKVERVKLANGETEYEFTDLPVYAVPCDELDLETYDGHVFEYTVTEDEVEGYTSVQTGTNFTNTIAQDYTELSGTKTWIDPEGTEHATIVINLLRDGEKVESVKLANGETEYEFTDLPVYAVPTEGYTFDEYDGHVFEYTVTEDEVEGYTSVQTGNNFTNTIAQDYTELSGTKTWIDPVGTVHPDITISLLRDGVAVESVVLKNGETEYAFTDLPIYEVPCDELDLESYDGHAFAYTVSEDLVPGYTRVQNGVDFVNTIEQELISISGTKTWVDAEDVTHPTITISLLRDGTVIDSVKLANGTTRYSFRDLPKYDLTTGEAYKYTVAEKPVEGYTSRQSGTNFTNTAIKPSKVSISGTKTWVDDGRTHDNASEVLLTLYRRTATTAYQPVEDAVIRWNGNRYTFSGLARCDEAGNEYQYIVEEKPVDGYDTTYEGMDIINRMRVEVKPVEVSGTKHWIDNDNAAGLRPTSVTVYLQQDGEVIQTAVIGEAEGWAYTFADLPDNDGYGHYYTYTVREKLVHGYYLTVKDNDLYNTLRPTEEKPPFEEHPEEELEELISIFDYGVPLWGGLLGTGDELPVYPFVMGGVGVLALVAIILLNRKRKKGLIGMKKTLTILLSIIMVVCFAGALSYPIRYALEKDQNESDMDQLRAMREAALQSTVLPAAQSTTNPEPMAAPESSDTSDPQSATNPEPMAAPEGSDTSAPQSAKTSEPADGSQASGQAAVSSDESSEEVKFPQTPESDAATESPVSGFNEETAEPSNLIPGLSPAAELDIVREEPSGSALPEEPGAVLTAESMIQPGEDMRTPLPTITPEPTDRRYRTNAALPYPDREKVTLDEDSILPQYRAIYEQNHDLVGWLSIPGTPIDYPVLQNSVWDYYLKKDFYGKKNANGQLILDSACDPYTPSYNLVISGHNMKSGKMFGTLANYASRSYWAAHKILTFDTLMREGQYVVMAAFYSADYDVDEAGFRYNADVQYRLDADLWLEEVIANREYDTGIDAEFGDEFLTLTTCLYQRKNGRFVVVARRVREGEVIE